MLTNEYILVLTSCRCTFVLTGGHFVSCSLCILLRTHLGFEKSISRQDKHHLLRGAKQRKTDVNAQVQSSWERTSSLCCLNNNILNNSGSFFVFLSFFFSVDLKPILKSASQQWRLQSKKRLPWLFQSLIAQGSSEVWYTHIHHIPWRSLLAVREQTCFCFTQAQACLVTEINGIFAREEIQEWL